MAMAKTPFDIRSLHLIHSATHPDGSAVYSEAEQIRRAWCEYRREDPTDPAGWLDDDE